MRSLALAAIMGAAVLGVADARTWSDPNGRLIFDAPSGWVMEVQRANPQTIVLAGDANNECYLIATPNNVTANSSPDAVKRTLTQPFTPEAWMQLANSVRPMFPNNSAELVSQSVDTSGFWPIQRAEFRSPERPVVAATQSRPGLDLMAFCWTYGGPDATARYEAVFRSMAHSNDTTWQAAYEEQQSQRAAAAAAAAAPPQPAEPETDD